MVLHRLCAAVALKCLLSSLLVLGLLIGGTVSVAMAQAVAPQSGSYQAEEALLRRVRDQYRQLGAHAAWQQRLPPLPSDKLEPGQAYDGVALLLQRLVALGDVPADIPVPARYEGAMVEGVKAFQHRHGLLEDGVLGRRTLEQLAVSPAARLAQIEQALNQPAPEVLDGDRVLVVNVPEFMLRGYVRKDGHLEQALQMRVIVGRAAKTQTPLISAPMRYIEFKPYWNVPPSIARKELVPQLRRDPGHFDAQGFEFVFADGHVETTLSDAALSAVLQGEARLRQRPGPHNALGDIKFAFPNRDSIYLHHTPSVGLFERVRRDFSHGCIRVEAPVDLARFVLADQPEWDEARIRGAMEGAQPSTLRLAEAIPVLIDYRTVRVDATGKVYFFADLYGLEGERRPLAAM